MTLTELRAFIRLQIDETEEAYWDDDDIDTYITLAAQRFTRRAFPIIHRESISISNATNAETAVAEVVSITCVADLTSGTGTIGGQYFKLYDVDDTEYLVWYDVDDGDTAPTGSNLIEVDISADDTVNTVASATSSAINATTGFTASVNSSVVTVTLESGYVSNTHANVNVDNGTDTFGISVTTTGLDAYYALTYKLLKERSAVAVDADGDQVSMTRVAYEDWIKHDSDERGDYKIFYIDPSHSDRVYLPVSLTGSTVYFEYYVKAETANISSFLTNDLIPEEWHETLAKYAISLAFRRDGKLTESRDYLHQYIADETEARTAFSELNPNSYSNEFTLDITNPHRDESILFNNGMSL